MARVVVLGAGISAIRQRLSSESGWRKTMTWSSFHPSLITTGFHRISAGHL